MSTIRVSVGTRLGVFSKLVAVPLDWFQNVTFQKTLLMIIKIIKIIKKYSFLSKGLGLYVCTMSAP